MRHRDLMSRTQFAQGVSAAFVEAHRVHGLAGGCFHAHVFSFGCQQVHEDLLHVVLVEMFPIVGCAQEKTYICNSAYQVKGSGLKLERVRPLSSPLLTVQSSLGKAGNCIVSYVGDLGDEHKLHQPRQSSALVDHLRRLTVAQTVGDHPQGVDVEVDEFLWETITKRKW